MASRRDLKKKINQFILADVIDECIFLEEQNPMMTKINQAKTKSDFREINEIFDARVDEFVDALNQINA